MKVSEITPETICQQAHVETGMLDDPAEALLLQSIREAAVEYAKSYTGLTADELEEHEDLTIAVLVLAADLYENRTMTVDKSNVNRVAETILGMHCRNLL
jgi:hypothetical protein